MMIKKKKQLEWQVLQNLATTTNTDQCQGKIKGLEFSARAPERTLAAAEINMRIIYNDYYSNRISRILLLQCTAKIYLSIKLSEYI